MMKSPTLEEAATVNIHVFRRLYNIKNEQGLALEFKKHPFLWDIYEDFSPLQVILKAPQIGATVMMIVKSFWIAKNLHKDIIYTLPTASDVNDMAGGKINRLLAQNPIFLEWVNDHDTVEQKNVGDNIIYYRGTWTSKAAMMVSSSLNIHDEVDASKPETIEQYETRLQAQKGGWRWYFSHPSVPDFGVDKYWQISDQKHWFIKCPECQWEQYLQWPESIDPERRCYQCTKCKAELSDEVRRKGRWVAKYQDREFSGYWISQLMYIEITAEKILNDFKEKTPEYFWNYVLGLPYAGGDSKLTQQALFANLTNTLDVPLPDERVIIGVDTGLKLDFVLGNERLGLFYHGEADAYGTLDGFMERWKNAIVVMDAGGDLIGSRQFAERYPGRVFLAYAGEDRKTNELVRWGTQEEQTTVLYDLNRMWQLCVDEFREQRIPLQGGETDWWEYWLDWKNMSRIKVMDTKTGMYKGIKWVRGGRNHRASATLFWRVGMMKFATVERGELVTKGEKKGSFGYESKDGAAFIPIIRSRK